MATQHISRRATLQPSTSGGKANAAPVYVDSDDNILKIVPGGAGSTTEVQVIDESSTQTLSGKTLTSPVLNSPTINNVISGSTKVSTATFSATSAGTGTTLTNITGLTAITLVAGATYRFRVFCPVVSMTTNCGLKMAFKLTTATLTSVNARVRQSTDTNNTGEVSTSFTTATDQATWFAQNAVVYTNVEIEGTLIVNAAGTIAVQAAQNASHADTTSITAGAYAEFVRVA